MGQKSGITYTRLFSPATLAHQRKKRAGNRPGQPLGKDEAIP